MIDGATAYATCEICHDVIEIDLARTAWAMGFMVVEESFENRGWAYKDGDCYCAECRVEIGL